MGAALDLGASTACEMHDPFNLSGALSLHVTCTEHCLNHGIIIL